MIRIMLAHGHSIEHISEIIEASNLCRRLENAMK